MRQISSLLEIKFAHFWKGFLRNLALKKTQFRTKKNSSSLNSKFFISLIKNLTQILIESRDIFRKIVKICQNIVGFFNADQNWNWSRRIDFDHQ